MHIRYFSAKTLSHLKPQQGLLERYQHRALDVTLACKLTYVYGKYHIAMLHRELAMSEERTTYQQAERQADPSRQKATEDVYHVDARGGGGLQKTVHCTQIRKERQKTTSCLKNLEVIKKLPIFAASEMTIR